MKNIKNFGEFITESLKTGKLSNSDIEKELSIFSKTNKEFLKLQGEADAAYHKKRKLEKEKITILKKDGDTKKIDAEIKKFKNISNIASDASLKLLKKKQKELESKLNENSTNTEPYSEIELIKLWIEKGDLHSGFFPDIKGWDWDGQALTIEPTDDGEQTEILTKAELEKKGVLPVDGKTFLDMGYDNISVIVYKYPVSDRYCHTGDIGRVSNKQIRVGGAWFDLDERWVVKPMLKYVLTNATYESNIFGITPKKLIKDKIYEWTGGAKLLDIKYLGRTDEFPQIKPSSSVGKGWLFQWVDSKKYFEISWQTMTKDVVEKDETNERLKWKAKSVVFDNVFDKWSKEKIKKTIKELDIKGTGSDRDIVYWYFVNDATEEQLKKYFGDKLNESVVSKPSEEDIKRIYHYKSEISKAKWLFGYYNIKNESDKRELSRIITNFKSAIETAKIQIQELKGNDSSVAKKQTEKNKEFILFTQKGIDTAEKNLIKESASWVLGMNLLDLSVKDISEEITDIKRDLRVIEDYEKGNLSYGELLSETTFKPTDKDTLRNALKALADEKMKRIKQEKYITENKSLIVKPTTSDDKIEIEKLFDREGYDYNAEFNEFNLPEENLDALEMELSRSFNRNGINASFLSE